MRLSFSGLDDPLDIQPGRVTTLEVANAELFSRICVSLREGRGRQAPEPYTLWNDEEELSPKDALIFIESPLELPWNSKSLLGTVIKRFQTALLEDEELRTSIDRSAADIVSKYMSLSMTMHAEYSFEVEWDIQKFAKAFGFGVDRTSQQSILDSCIDFLSLALDAGVNQCIVFVNLKSFLTEKGLEILFEHVFFANILVLLLERWPDDITYAYERKRVIDLDFIEH
jgi:CRISPR-associated protein Csn2